MKEKTKTIKISENTKMLLTAFRVEYFKHKKTYLKTYNDVIKTLYMEVMEKWKTEREKPQ